MKTIRRVIQVSIVVLFFLTISIPAQAMSGNTLAELCASEGKENPISSNSSMCIGLLLGYLEGLEYGFVLMDKKVRFFCEPKEVKVKQLMKIFNKYLAEHPENLHFKYGPEFIKAMSEAFPCKNN